MQDDDRTQSLFQRAMLRFKLDSLPTRNPHVLYSLLSNPNPWKGRAINLMTSNQFCACLENVYYDYQSLRQAAAFRPKPTDIIVTSVARAGATPIVWALDSLRNGKVTDLEELHTHVPWVESKDSSISAELGEEEFQNPSRRILKTTMPIRNCLGMNRSTTGINTIAAHSPKVVVVLRDPLDLRLSWYRHSRRIYRKMTRKGKQFDQKFSLDDFANVPVPSCNPTFTSAIGPNEQYEKYVREVLLFLRDSIKARRHIHIVFYEELLADCENTIRKLANFCFSDDPATLLATRRSVVDENLLRDIVDAIQDSEDFPSTMNEYTGKLRVGSTGQGHAEFTRREVDQIDDDWDNHVRVHFPEYDQYSQLYEALVDSPYPHHRVRPFEEDLEKGRRKSTGLSQFVPAGSRLSLLDLKVTKFVQKRLASSESTTFHTGVPSNSATSAGSKTSKKSKQPHFDPDDTDDEERQEV